MLKETKLKKKTTGAIHENYSLLSDAESLNDDWVVTNEYDNLIARDNLVCGKLPISKLLKKRLTKEVKI